MANEYICIDDLIKELKIYRNQYGNLPVLISAEGSNIDFLKPLKEIFGVNMTEQATGNTQLAIILTNYEVEDIDDSGNNVEIDIEI